MTAVLLPVVRTDSSAGRQASKARAWMPGTSASAACQGSVTIVWPNGFAMPASRSISAPQRDADEEAALTIGDHVRPLLVAEPRAEVRPMQRDTAGASEPEHRLVERAT